MNPAPPAAPPPDDFDAASLAAAFATAAPPGLADRVFAATTPVLQARRRARAFGRAVVAAGGLALAFALGRATSEEAASSAGAASPAAVPNGAAGPDPASAPTAAPTEDPAATPAAPRDDAALAAAREAAEEAAAADSARALAAAPPERLERLAARSEGPLRAALYRVAGDRYMAERSDVDAALRCYRAHLRAAAHAERRVGRDDHWLLAALKAEAE